MLEWTHRHLNSLMSEKNPLSIQYSIEAWLDIARKGNFSEDQAPSSYQEKFTNERITGEHGSIDRTNLQSRWIQGTTQTPHNTFYAEPAAKFVL